MKLEFRELRKHIQYKGRGGPFSLHWLNVFRQGAQWATGRTHTLWLNVSRPEPVTTDGQLISTVARDTDSHGEGKRAIRDYTSQTLLPR